MFPPAPFFPPNCWPAPHPNCCSTALCACAPCAARVHVLPKHVKPKHALPPVDTLRPAVCSPNTLCTLACWAFWASSAVQGRRAQQWPHRSSGRATLPLSTSRFSSDQTRLLQLAATPRADAANCRRGGRAQELYRRGRAAATAVEVKGEEAGEGRGRAWRPTDGWQGRQAG